MQTRLPQRSNRHNTPSPSTAPTGCAPRTMVRAVLGLLLVSLGFPAGATPAAPQVVATVRPAPGYSLRLLDAGREVYADLQQARDATWRHDRIDLRLALDDARRALNDMDTPIALRALRAQTRITERDLGDMHKIPDQALWEPITAEVEDVLVDAPQSVRQKAQQTLQHGREAARRGDRATARKQLDILYATVEYQIALFPLHRVQGDVRAARRAARLPTPDWTAAREAVYSALAQLHWFTRISAYDLLRAYYDVADAYARWPQNQPLARRDLIRAGRDLQDTPGLRDMADRASRMAHNEHLRFIAISRFRNDLLQQIHIKQRHTAESFNKDQLPAAS